MIVPVSLPQPRAVLLDMDGTLTEPLLDFPRIKAEMGIGNQAILEALAAMDQATRRAAEIILHRHEDQAAGCSTLNPGCRELLADLAALGIGTALITRNSRSSTLTVLARHALPIDILITRDDAPPKPSAEPLKLACDRLGIDLAQAWMVGDGQYDVEAAVAAGMPAVWVSHGRSRHFAAMPTCEVRDLWAVCELLRSTAESASASPNR